MAVPGELTGIKDNVIKCCDCNSDLPLRVLCSAAGHYIGRWCPQCGPYTRETGYYKSNEEAQKALDTMSMGNMLRDTEYKPS